MILRDCLNFVLLEPSHAGNIGSAARALKVMGFRHLSVVAPRESDPAHHPEAIAFASRASDVLEGLQVFETLEQALAESQLNIAVSAEGREFGPRMLTPEALASTLAELFSAQAEAAPPKRISLIFGTERTGLPISVVQRCHLLCAIPTEGEYNSLNLSQAVQVLAYVLARQVGQLRPSEPVRQAAARHEHWADDASTEAFYAHLERTLVSIGFLDPAAPRKLMPRLRRLFSRARLTNKEIDILRGILSQATPSNRP